jgi:SAM-dependent methyltransferase
MSDAIPNRNDAQSETEGVVAFYDDVAADYFRQYERQNLEASGKYPQNFFRLQWLVQRLAQTGARSVYEVGTGEGTPLAVMARMGLDVAGCDISERMVEHSQKRLAEVGVDPSRVQWADVDDKTTLVNQVALGPFDAAVAFGVMPHVLRDEVALRNMRVFVRDGGRLYVEFRNKLFSLFTFNRLTKEFILDDLLRDVAADVRGVVAEELDRRVALDQPKREDTAGRYDAIRARFHNPFEVSELLQGAGFETVQFHWYHFHPAPPLLEDALGDRFAEEARKLEFSTDWRGHFLCSAFVVEASAV